MRLKPYNKSGLYRTIAAVGGLSKLAQALTSKCGKPVSRQVIFQWKKYGRIPAPFITYIHELTLIPFADLLEPFEPVLTEKEKDEKKPTRK